jgi:UDP-glucose 4-epimerase
MKSIIVTGCAGLLGSHFCRHLLKTNRVIGIDDLSGGYADYLPSHSNFIFHTLDLCGREAKYKLDYIFEKEKPTACYHFAAYAAEGLSPFIRHYNYTNNILSSANVINQCINHDTKMIFTSSMAVYGDQTAPFTEDMLPSPVDPYGVAKYAIEMDMKIAADQHDMRYTIIRPHNIVGIYQNIWDKYRNVVGIFIRRVLANKPMLIYGDGKQTRAFSDIKYYMEPFEKVMNENDGKIFNIGADKAYTINELALAVTKVAIAHGMAPAIEHVEPRHEVKHAHCNHNKAKEMLDFSDDTNLEETIDEMFKWATKQPVREQKRMDYEIERGIYDYWK